MRIVNALDAEAEVDVTQVLDELGVSAESRASATATVLAGADPYAGEIGKSSPTVPVETSLDLTSGTYTAPPGPSPPSPSMTNRGKRFSATSQNI